jgi:ATP-binding protein involved in chromosome partitioning
LPGVGAIVAVSSAKGGVGKSTVTVNLAAALRSIGKTVGILDADILGPSIPGMLGIPSLPPQPGANAKLAPQTAYGIKVVSMAMFSGDDQPMMLRGPMVGKYLNMFLAGVDWGRLDILLLDMPPGTGDIQLNIAQAFPLTGAIIVTTPQAVSTKIARRGARMFETVRTPILGIIENMRTFTCPACGTAHDLFGHGGGERLAADLGVPFLGALPLDATVIEAGDEGVPLATGPSADAYRVLAGTIDAAIAGNRDGLGTFRWHWADDRGAPPWNEDDVREGGAADMPAGLCKRDEHTLSILWQDGVQQDIDVRDLRLSCGCALCKDEMTGRPLLDPASVPADIVPVEVRSIGNYAIAPSWSDGHTSGIHPFAALRQIAPRGEAHLHSPALDIAQPAAVPAPEPRTDAAVLAAVRDYLDRQFNPAIARHRGEVRAVDVAEGVLTVEMRGGCQGCAASKLTLQQGLVRQLRVVVPEVRQVVDVTDHAGGARPYFPAQAGRLAIEGGPA